MPVKGAIGLVTAAVTLTGRSYPCLIFFSIDDTASIIPLKLVKLEISLAQIVYNAQTSCKIEKLT